MTLLRELNESNKIVARWVKTKGPNNTHGFDLQRKSPLRGWRSVGFVTQKPSKMSGTIDVYDGTKDIKVNLNNFSF